MKEEDERKDLEDELEALMWGLQKPKEKEVKEEKREGEKHESV